VHRPFLLPFPTASSEARDQGSSESLKRFIGKLWAGFEIVERFPLSAIAEAHEFVERPPRDGRVVEVLSILETAQGKS